MPWKLLDSRPVLTNEWIEVRSNDYATSDGRTLRDYYLVRRKDYAMIVAESRGKLVMVREFRAGMNGDYLGFPAGHLEPGEDPLDAARREFREETGFSAKSARLLGEMHPQAAWLESRCYVVYIEASDSPDSSACDGEIDEVILLDWEQAIEKARAGELGEMQAVAALYLARDLLQRG